MLAKVRARLGKAAKEEKGFTLIELLAVIVILGIIAVIAVPLIGNIISDSRNNSDLATAQQIYDASRLYVIGEENGVFGGQTITLAELRTAGYLDAGLRLPSNKAPITLIEVSYDTDGNLFDVRIAPPPSGSTAGTDAEAGSGIFSAPQILSSQITPTTGP